MTDDDQRRAEQVGVEPPTDRVSDDVNSPPIISNTSETVLYRGSAQDDADFSELQKPFNWPVHPVRWVTLESVLNDPSWSAEAKEQVLMLVLYEGREH